MGHNFSFCTGCETPRSCDLCEKLANGVQEINGDTSGGKTMKNEDWDIEESRKFLEKTKEIKIAFCEKWGLPIPAFDKEEDYFLPEECPICMTKEVALAERLAYWMYIPNSTNMGRALWELNANYCPRCGRKIKRECSDSI